MSPCRRPPSGRHCYHIPMPSGRPLPVCLFILISNSYAAAAAPQPIPAETLRLCAIQLSYEQEDDDAIRLMRQAITLKPDSTAVHRTLASVLWLKILFLRGAVTVD